MNEYRKSNKATKFSRTEYLESSVTKKYLKKNIPSTKMGEWIREATAAKMAKETFKGEVKPPVQKKK